MNPIRTLNANVEGSNGDSEELIVIYSYIDFFALVPRLRYEAQVPPLNTQCLENSKCLLGKFEVSSLGSFCLFCESGNKLIIKYKQINTFMCLFVYILQNNV